MPTEVFLPKVDMDMDSGKIIRWYVKEGDRVEKGDNLFEMETDKSAIDVEAEASGTLRNVSAKEGDTVAVGHTVAWIHADGE